MITDPEKTERNKEIYIKNLQGYSYHDLAKIYGVSSSRIGQIIMRVKKKLAGEKKI